MMLASAHTNIKLAHVAKCFKLEAKSVLARSKKRGDLRVLYAGTRRAYKFNCESFSLAINIHSLTLSPGRNPALYSAA